MNPQAPTFAPAAAAAPKQNQKQNPREPKPKAPPKASVQLLRDAAKAVEAKAVSDVSQRTLRNIVTRLDALERQSGFQASNFGRFSASEIDSALGIATTAPTLQAAAEKLDGVISGTAIMDKRFGKPGNSVMMKTNADMNYVLAAADGFEAGQRLIAVVPLDAAYKGGALIAQNANTGLWTVLKYFSSDKDPELVSTSLAVAYASLEVRAPMAMTGTGTTVTAQIMAQGGLTSDSPLFIRNGRLSSFTNKPAPLVVLGANTLQVSAFTADLPAADVLRSDSYDTPNPRISLQTANAADYPVQQSVLAGTVTNALQTTFTARDAATAYASGFTSYIADGFGAGATAANSDVVIFNFSTADEYTRTILYGRFRGELQFASNVAGGTVTFTVTYDLGAGEEQDVTQTWYTSQQSVGGLTRMRIDGTGASSFAPFAGYFINNITVTVAATNGVIRTSASNAPLLTLEWLDINANRQYLSAMLTGALEGFQIGINSTSQTEIVQIARTADAAYLAPSDDPPYHTPFYAEIVNAHRLVAPNFEASSWRDTLGKVLRYSGKVARVAAPLAGPYAGPLTDLANAASGAGRVISSTGIPQNQARYTATPYRPSRRLRRGHELFAAPLLARDEPDFGWDTLASTVDFCFPAVREEAAWRQAVLLPILPGGEGLADPEIEAQLPGLASYPTRPRFSGPSGSFAYLVRALHERGIPCPPGAYSGAVTNLFVFGEVVAFDVEPVGDRLLKSVVCAQRGAPLYGNLENHIYFGGELVREFPAQAFGPRSRTRTMALDDGRVVLRTIITLP